MAVIKGSFHSEVLGKITNYTAILPDKQFAKVAVLYLLHGRSGNADSWLNQTGLIRHLKDLPIAVFCPEASLSYYQDMPMGENYWQYLSKEFPVKMQQFHPINWTQEFVAGNSMGGYGALSWLLSEPTRFRAGGLFSPLVNPEQLLATMPGITKELISAFGTASLSETDKNLCNQADFEKLPFIYHQCGSNDFLLDDSLKLSQRMVGNNHYRQVISQGKHDWDEWDHAIKNFILIISEQL